MAQICSKLFSLHLAFYYTTNSKTTLILPSSSRVSYVSTMSPLRLCQVLGNENRANDVLFQPAAANGALGREVLVFFGGDVQDYPEVMEAHRDNRKFLRWNLERTARMLGVNFPNKHILVVRPSRMEYKSFSYYDNFVLSNSAGAPEHGAAPRALPHLARLLHSASIRLKATPASELMEAVRSPASEDIDVDSQGAPGGGRAPVTDPLWWLESLALHEGSLSLVGFSKGCVVLNQVIYEFHSTHTTTPADKHITSVSERVREMYWLDGGHAGGAGAWLTDANVLRALAATGVQIYVHVSPYQVEDESRPWIGREEKIFTSSLKKMGAKVCRYWHAAEGPPSLHTHFSVLERFKRMQDADRAQE